MLKLEQAAKAAKAAVVAGAAVSEPEANTSTPEGPVHSPPNP
jgi:hypothetical protein